MKITLKSKHWATILFFLIIMILELTSCSSTPTNQLTNVDASIPLDLRSDSTAPLIIDETAPVYGPVPEGVRA